VNARFDDAHLAVIAIARELARRRVDVTVVRDLFGRMSLVVDRSESLSDDEVEQFRNQVVAAAHPFVSSGAVVRSSSLDVPEVVVKNTALQTLVATSDVTGRVTLLEFGVVGRDWVGVDPNPPIRRATLYGFKGGVGRTTATYQLAQHLAAAGKCVLVVDLDLESPGLSSFLEETSLHPSYGVIDELVEAAVDNSAGLDLVAQIPLSVASGTGEFWLAPASGLPRHGYAYVPKLNRIYADLPGGSVGRISFANRLERAVQRCEERVTEESRRPDIVLLDSRAGIHDIAAIAITQLSDLTLLFATDSPQTWNGYRELFSQWALDGATARRVRRRLKMVASMVPPGGQDEYLRAFRDHAQSCFADTLYDEIVNSEDEDSYNPSPHDEDAPHFPLPILFTSDLLGLDPSSNREWMTNPLVSASFGQFLDQATDLLPMGDDS
jgi:hypothetical protein